MVEDNALCKLAVKKGKILMQPGQPLQFVEIEDAEPSNLHSASVPTTIGHTLRAYIAAARRLLEGKYAGQKELAPPHMRAPCDILVLRCSDGILVRYDAVSEMQASAKIRCADLQRTLTEISPQFSEQVIHFPQDPQAYIPPSGGPELILSKIATENGAPEELMRIRYLIYATTTLPDGFEMPTPPARPPCLVAIPNEFDLHLHGHLETLDPSAKPAQSGTDAFVVHSRVRLPVGWQTIEIYPPLGDEYWRPEYARTWAELDLLATIVQNNQMASTLNAVDGRGAARKYYAELLKEFDALLGGPEEPVHQFLKQHPEILCPTNDRHWSKLPFGKGAGKRVSDFVFREPPNDYLLVEIEAPIRELFRKDGQQREELTHAINQIMDWIQYINNNRKEVEEDLGLAGISANPRTLVVIGRSSSLTEDNRRKLIILQAQQNKLRILTYDDLIASARANLERILGPLEIQGQNAEFYFYKPSST